MESLSEKCFYSLDRLTRRGDFLGHRYAPPLATIDRQLLLHGAAEACESLLIRPGRLPDEPEPPILGEQYDRDQIFEKLAPALAEAWPEHPTEPEDLPQAS